MRAIWRQGIFFDPGLTKKSRLTECVVSLSTEERQIWCCCYFLSCAGGPFELSWQIYPAWENTKSFVPDFSEVRSIPWLNSQLGSRNSVSQYCCRVLCFVKPWLKRDLCFKEGCGYCAQWKLLVGLYFSYSAWRNRILYKVNKQDCTKSRGVSSSALGTRSYNLLASILTASDMHVFFKWKKSVRVQMLKKSQDKRVNTEFFVLWRALKGTGTMKCRRTRIHIVFYSVYGSSAFPSHMASSY